MRTRHGGFSIQDVETARQTVWPNIQGRKRTHVRGGTRRTQTVVTLRMKHWLEVDGRFAIGDGGAEFTHDYAEDRPRRTSCAEGVGALVVVVRGTQRFHSAKTFL